MLRNPVIAKRSGPRIGRDSSLAQLILEKSAHGTWKREGVDFSPGSSCSPAFPPSSQCLPCAQASLPSQLLPGLTVQSPAFPYWRSLTTTLHVSWLDFLWQRLVVLLCVCVFVHHIPPPPPRPVPGLARSRASGSGYLLVSCSP